MIDDGPIKSVTGMVDKGINGKNPLAFIISLIIFLIAIIYLYQNLEGRKENKDLMDLNTSAINIQNALVKDQNNLLQKLIESNQEILLELRYSDRPAKGNKR